jgi:hypothetical protein
MLEVFVATLFVGLLGAAFPIPAVILCLLLLPVAFCHQDQPLTDADRTKEIRRLRRFMDGRTPDPMITEFLRLKHLEEQVAAAAALHQARSMRGGGY